MCGSIIRAAGTLSLERRLSWRVAERPDPGARALARELRARMRRGEIFELPRAVAARSTVSFAIPDAAFPLALLCIWFEGAVEEPVRSTDGAERRGREFRAAAEEIPETPRLAQTYLGLLLSPQSAGDAALLRAAISALTA